jgi:uncharacterized protein YuzE
MSADSAPLAVSWDPSADALYVRIAPHGTFVAETTEVLPGVMLDLAANGSLIGIEVIGVRGQMDAAACARPQQH